MVDWTVQGEGTQVTAEGGTVMRYIPRTLHISCRIINAGNIPAMINRIETRWLTQTNPENPSATVIPNSVGYVYRYTIDFTTVPNIDGDRFGGAIRGEIRYSNHFGG